MNFSTYRFGDELANSADVGKTFLAENGLTVEVFHIRKDTSIMNNFESENIVNGKHILAYLVIKGKLEVRFEDKKVVVEAGNSIKVDFTENFSVWALEDSDFFGVHNCVEPEVDNTPAALVKAVKEVELADAYLKGHNYRVGKYSTLIMQAMCPERSTPSFMLAASYHDIGKICIPSEILNKEGRLTDDEFAAIKKHPAVSYEMLIEHIGEENARYARWHHEKLDGSGYPDGISGDAIPLESRIMAVVDIFDALTTDRCYRSGFSFARALSIIEHDVQAGKLDADVYKILKQMVDSGIIVEGVDNMFKDANTLVHYDGFTIADIRNALSTSKTGMWRLESEPGKPVRFYGDEIMNELIGVPDSTAPEERMKLFMSRIHPEDQQVFMEYYENIKKKPSEIIYRYVHPEQGVMYVRCGGKRDDAVTAFNCYRGFHQNITSTIRIEEENKQMDTATAELYQKMASKLMNNFASSAMYIDLQERTYKWLACREDRLNGIEYYGDLGRRYCSFMPEESAKVFIKEASMDNLIEVFKNQDEFSFSVDVYDKDGHLRRTTMWYTCVDEAHRFVLAVSRDTTQDVRR